MRLEETEGLLWGWGFHLRSENYSTMTRSGNMKERATQSLYWRPHSGPEILTQILTPWRLLSYSEICWNHCHLTRWCILDYYKTKYWCQIHISSFRQRGQCVCGLIRKTQNKDADCCIACRCVRARFKETILSRSVISLQVIGQTPGLAAF